MKIKHIVSGALAVGILTVGAVPTFAANSGDNGVLEQLQAVVREFAEGEMPKAPEGAKAMNRELTASIKVLDEGEVSEIPEDAQIMNRNMVIDVEVLAEGEMPEIPEGAEVLQRMDMEISE